MIDSFHGENMFLSNFFVHPITIGDIKYPSNEHAYQAAKTINNEMRKTIATCGAPGVAKKLGRRVDIRPDWEQIKDSVMEEICREKFTNSVLRKRLLATGTEELIEGNWWGDRYWGMVKDAGNNWKGENMLGKILMKIREELKIIIS